MFHRFKWTRAAAYRNRLLAEAEPIQPFFILALAEAAGCKTFLDIGASTGAYALFATQLPFEKIIAIEATPGTARELRSNLAFNNAPVEVIEAAVSDHDGHVVFGVSRDLAGDNAVIDTALHDGFTNTLPVQSIRLDSLSVPDPICLKIDVEGHEKAVAAGATKLLKRPCVIQVEDFAGEMASVLKIYRELTQIGPDHYFTNIPGIDALQIYEKAVHDFTVSASEAPYSPAHITKHKGDFTFSINGQTASRLRRLMGRA